MSSTATQTLHLAPITVHLGSEVSGVDLNDLDTDLADAIYRALLDRGVLVFRDQQITSETHVALGRSFGPLADPHPLYPSVEGFTDIIRVRNDENNPPENEVWHSDLSCRPAPPFVSVLRGALIPPVGGDTLWADLRAIHDALSPAQRSMLEGLTATHSLEQGFRFLDDFVSNEETANDEQRSRQAALGNTAKPENRTSHPVIVRHPATGRSIVYVNESFTESINGVSPEESQRVLSHLYAQVRNPRFQMRLRWTPNTVVMWDNWATQHFACGDHYPQRREVQRVTVAADRRSGPFGL